MVTEGWYKVASSFSFLFVLYIPDYEANCPEMSVDTDLRKINKKINKKSLLSLLKGQERVDMQGKKFWK